MAEAAPAETAQAEATETASDINIEETAETETTEAEAAEAEETEAEDVKEEETAEEVVEEEVKKEILVTVQYRVDSEKAGSVSSAEETIDIAAENFADLIQGATATANAKYRFLNWKDENGNVISSDTIIRRDTLPRSLQHVIQ